MPSRLVHRRKLVPICKNNGVLKVATCDPFDLYAFDELRMLTGLQVEPVLASEAEIDRSSRSTSASAATPSRR